MQRYLPIVNAELCIIDMTLNTVPSPTGLIALCLQKAEMWW